MEKEIKIILGIAFLFTLITSVITLVGRLSIIFTSDNLKRGLNLFFLRNFLWVIIVAGVIIVLYMYSKKMNIDASKLISDGTIRITAGILIIIDGLSSLASSLSISFISIKSAFDASVHMGLSGNSVIAKSVATNAISIILMLCQILIGIYMARYYKNQSR